MSGEILELDVEFISIVKKPATGKAFVLKSGKKVPVRAFALTKMDDDRQMAYGIVYPVGEEDAHGHRASAAVVEKAAGRFLREGRATNVDLDHGFTKQDAYVAESWLLRKGDPLFPDDPEGSWAVGVKVLDPALWKALKTGEYVGFSLFGFGQVRDDAPDTDPTIVKTEAGILARLANLLKGDDRMDLSEADMDKLADKVAAKLSKASPADPPPAPPVPPANPEPDPAADAVATLAKTVEALTTKVESLSTDLAKATAPGQTEGEPATATEAAASFM